MVFFTLPRKAKSQEGEIVNYQQTKWLSSMTECVCVAGTTFDQGLPNTTKKTLHEIDSRDNSHQCNLLLY